jgi:hypothetical protein
MWKGRIVVLGAAAVDADIWGLLAV